MEGCSSPLVVKFADTQKEKEQKKVLQLQNNLWSLSAAAGAPPQATTLAAATPPGATANLIGSQYLTVRALRKLFILMLSSISASYAKSRNILEYQILERTALGWGRF